MNKKDFAICFFLTFVLIVFVLCLFIGCIFNYKFLADFGIVCALFTYVLSSMYFLFLKIKYGDDI